MRMRSLLPQSVKDGDLLEVNGVLRTVFCVEIRADGCSTLSRPSRVAIWLADRKLQQYPDLKFYPQALGQGGVRQEIRLRVVRADE